MEGNNFIFDFIASLLQSKSKKQIQEDIKSMGDIKFPLVGTLSPKTKAQLKKDIASLNGTVNLTGKVDSKDITTSVQKATQQAQRQIDSKPVEVAFSVKKEKLLNDIKLLAQQNSRLFKNSDMSIKYNSLLDNAEMARNSVELSALRTQLGSLRSELKITGNAGLTFGDSLKKSLSKVMGLFGNFNIIMQFKQQLRNAWVEANELDKSMTDLSRVNAEITRSGFPEYLDKVISKTKQLAAATKDYIDSVTTFSRAGYNLVDSETLADMAVQLEKVGDMSAVDASKALLAGLQGYDKIDGYGMDQLTEKAQALNDKIDLIGNTASITQAELSQGIQAVGSVMNDTNTSVDEFLALLGAGNRAVQDSDKVALAIRTSALRIRGCTSELQEMGEETDNVIESTSTLAEKIKALTNIDGSGGVNILEEDEETFRSIFAIYNDISKVYDKMSDKDASALLDLIAGKNRSNQISAILQNMSEANALLESSLSATGTASEEYQIYLDSAEAATERFGVAMTEAYSSIISGDTVKGLANTGAAVLDFANSWNILEGTIKGFLTLGILKGITTLTVAFKNSALQISNYGNALNAVKDMSKFADDATRYASAFNLLKTSCVNLTDTQLKQVLANRNLSESQLIEILQLDTLEKEQVQARLSQLGLTQATVEQIAANGAATASTFSFSAAIKGLGVSIKTAFMSNPITFVIMGISTAIGVATSAISKYNRQLEETRQANLDAATTASENADKLKDLYNEYTRLASIQDRTTSEEEAFKTAVENITVALGDKAEILKDLTVGTDEYADALARVTKEELQSQAVTATIGRKSAEEKLQGKIWSDWNGSQVTIDSNDKGKSLSDEAQKAVDIVSESLKEYETINRTWKNISWDIDSDDPTKALEYYNSLVEAREKLVLASENDEALLDTEIYEDLNTAINSMSGSLDTYIEKLYEEQKLNYMAQNGIPSVTEEYKAMESALVSAAGSSVDLQDRFKELLTSDFSDLATNVEKVGEAVNSVTGQMNSAPVSLSISQTIDQLNTQLKPAFDSLKSAYQDIFTDDGFTLENVDTSMLNSIKSTIDELNNMEDVDINIDYSSFENLAKVLTDSSSTAEDVQNSFNNFASTILDAVNPAISQCDGESYKLLQTLLESMGIVNAEEVLMSQLGYSYEEYANAKESAANAGIDLNNSIDEVATALQNEGLMATEDAQQIMNYMLAKMSASGATIDVSSTIGQLAEEFSWLADLIDQWGLYYSVSQKGSGQGNVKGSKNLGVGNYTPTQTTKIKQKVEIEPVFDGNKANRAARSAGSKAGKSFEDGLREQLSDLDSVISGITGKISDQISAINEQKSAALDAISEEKEKLEEAKESAIAALEEERQKRLDVIEAQRQQIEQNIKSKQKVIDGINAEIKAMKDANSYRKLQNTLMKEQYELERLQHQHTILQYSEDKGIHYVANTKDIRSQKQAVDDAKLEIEIANKEKQIDLIEKEIDLLNDKLDILDEEEDRVNDYFDNLSKQTEKYFDQQIKALEKQRKEVEAFYSSLTKSLEQRKEKFQELTEILEKAELSAKLKQLGIDEEALLNGSEEEFEKLKNAYMDIVFKLNEGNDEVLNSLRELSGYDGTAPAMLEDSNTKLDTMNTELSTANTEVGNVNSALDKTATTTGNVATNVSDVNTNIGETTGLVNAQKGAFDELKQTIDLIVEAINKKIQAIEAGQSTVATAVGSEMANFQLLINKILEVKEKLDEINTTVSTMDRQPIDNLANAFQLLYDKVLLVSNLLGVSMEGEGEGAVSGITGAIQALNEISLEEGIIAQFTNLKEAIDSVTAAISGGGGESSEGEGSGDGSGSGSGGKSGGKGESGGGNSLTGAIKEMGDTAKEVIGEPDAEGDGTVIGEFGSMETAVNDVRDAIGTEGSEGGEGGNSGGETDDTLVGSIEYLGDKTEEEMGESGGDGIIGRFEEFESIIEEAANQVKSISEGLDEIDGKEVECTITVNVKMNGSIPAFASGTVLGNMQIESATYNAKYGKAFASGTIGLPKAEKNALVSEYGQTEMTVLPDGKTIITDTPTMMDLPKDTVIYNEEETKKIMDNKVDVSGNAHANGTDFIPISQTEYIQMLRERSAIKNNLISADEILPEMPLWERMEKCAAALGCTMDDMLNPLNSLALDIRKETGMGKLLESINNVNSVVNNTRNVQQPVVHQNVTISCPNVTNESGAENIRRELSTLSLRAMQEPLRDY